MDGPYMLDTNIYIYIRQKNRGSAAVRELAQVLPVRGLPETAVESYGRADVGLLFFFFLGVES